MGIVSTITEVGTSAEHRRHGGAVTRIFYFAALHGGEPGGDEPAAHSRPGRRTDFLPGWWTLWRMLLFRRRVPEKYQSSSQRGGLCAC